MISHKEDIILIFPSHKLHKWLAGEKAARSVPALHAKLLIAASTGPLLY